MGALTKGASSPITKEPEACCSHTVSNGKGEPDSWTKEVISLAMIHSKLSKQFRGVYSCTTFDFFPPPGPLIFFPAGLNYI